MRAESSLGSIPLKISSSKYWQEDKLMSLNQKYTK